MCLVTRAQSLWDLLPVGILGCLLLRVCTPALSHIITQKMADKATDAMFGEQEPAPPALELQTVRKLRKQRRYEEAIQHLETVLQGTPDDFESRFILACIYAEDLRDLAAAEREMKRIMDAYTISPGVQAMARQRLEIWQETHRCAKMILEGKMDPAEELVVQIEPTVSEPVIPPVPVGNVAASYEIVEDLCNTGNYGSAIGIIDQLLKRKQDDFKGLAIKARIFVQFLRQPAMADKAMRQLMTAADMSEEQAVAVNQLAEAFAKTKDDEIKAGRLWRKLLEMSSVPEEQKILVRDRLDQWQLSRT